MWTILNWCSWWAELILHHFQPDWNWNVKVRTLGCWILGEFWVEVNTEMLKHLLGWCRPNQKAIEIFMPHNSNVVFEHLKIYIIFVLKLSVTLLGGMLQKDLGMDLRSCCGIVTELPWTILWGIGIGNHSLHPFLVPVKVSVDIHTQNIYVWVYTEYKFCFQNQFVFSS